MKSEARAQHEVRLYLGQQPDLVLYRNNTGKIMQEGRMVHFGLCVGSSDLIGIYRPSGRFVAIEVKRPKGGRASREQKQFLNLVNNMGGAGVICRSVDEAEKFLTQLREGGTFPILPVN